MPTWGIDTMVGMYYDLALVGWLVGRFDTNLSDTESDTRFVIILVINNLIVVLLSFGTFKLLVSLDISSVLYK